MQDLYSWTIVHKRRRNCPYVFVWSQHHEILNVYGCHAESTSQHNPKFGRAVVEESSTKLCLQYLICTHWGTYPHGFHPHAALGNAGNTVICSLTYPSLVPLVGLDLGRSLRHHGARMDCHEAILEASLWILPGSDLVELVLGHHPPSGVSRCRVSFFFIFVIQGIHIGKCKHRRVSRSGLTYHASPWPSWPSTPGLSWARNFLFDPGHPHSTHGDVALYLFAHQDHLLSCLLPPAAKQSQGFQALRVQLIFLCSQINHIQQSCHRSDFQQTVLDGF